MTLNNEEIHLKAGKNNKASNTYCNVNITRFHYSTGLAYLTILAA